MFWIEVSARRGWFRGWHIRVAHIYRSSGVAMKSYLLLGSLILVTSLTGCTGKIVTENVEPTAMTQPNWHVEGVVIYPPALFKEISKTTVAVDKDGKVIGSETAGTCVPVTVSK